MYTRRPGQWLSCTHCAGVRCVPKAQVVLWKPACHSTAKSNSGLLCCVGNEGAILRGEAKRRVILDLAMGFLVGQGCCGSLCDHVPFEPRETCQHRNEH